MRPGHGCPDGRHTGYHRPCVAHQRGVPGNGCRPSQRARAWARPPLVDCLAPSDDRPRVRERGPGPGAGPVQAQVRVPVRGQIGARASGLGETASSRTLPVRTCRLVRAPRTAPSITAGHRPDPTTAHTRTPTRRQVRAPSLSELAASSEPLEQPPASPQVTDPTPPPPTPGPPRDGKFAHRSCQNLPSRQSTPDHPQHHHRRSQTRPHHRPHPGPHETASSRTGPVRTCRLVLAWTSDHRQAEENPRPSTRSRPAWASRVRISAMTASGSANSFQRKRTTV